MKKSQYDLVMSVCWRDVLRCLEWALSVRRYEAERWIDFVYMDIEHNYPDRFRDDVRKALGGCERVIYHFELLNSLRRFLNYKSKLSSQLQLDRCFGFYMNYKSESPDSACLAANTEGGQSNSR